MRLPPETPSHRRFLPILRIDRAEHIPQWDGGLWKGPDIAPGSEACTPLSGDIAKPGVVLHGSPRGPASGRIYSPYGHPFRPLFESAVSISDSPPEA